MKPKVSLCKELIKKYRQLQAKEKQLDELNTKIHWMLHDTDFVFKAGWHDEASAVRKTVTKLRDDFDGLMVRFEETVKAKEENDETRHR